MVKIIRAVLGIGRLVFLERKRFPLRQLATNLTSVELNEHIKLCRARQSLENSTIVTVQCKLSRRESRGCEEQWGPAAARGAPALAGAQTGRRDPRQLRLWSAPE
ncbi:hypothetical protein JYU34_014004 [Plutella xylostella]|uniref:Uncharacterized protein n=1 Tax=Plutella xylostella TaxID=51655 RepID=A0ABQ7Q7I0_PLUXY|nr:hypothetical protein JYU34_014004 [Plutella xylostella]